MMELGARDDSHTPYESAGMIESDQMMGMKEITALVYICNSAVYVCDLKCSTLARVCYREF